MLAITITAPNGLISDALLSRQHKQYSWRNQCPASPLQWFLDMCSDTVPVVINLYGSFGISGEANEWLNEHEGYDFDQQEEDEFSLKFRTDPRFVRCVRALGEKANGTDAHLEILDIPADMKWKLMDCEGIEWVEEVHRTWRPSELYEYHISEIE